MKQKNNSKSFLLIVIGQIISLFGNNILRFALSMTVLDLTGSVTIFASLLAISMIPTVLLSAFGGILADRVNKKKIMVCLDFLTCLLILLFSLLFHASSSLLAIAVLLVTLSVIQSFYQPSVQSSIPLLVPKEKLMQANGIVIQVNALATLIGPIIGGFLYGFFGLYPILYTSGICFFLSAVMELFIHIQNITQVQNDNIFKIIKTDFKQVFQFLINDQKPIFQLLLLVAAINLFLSAMILVGLPYMIKILLGFSNQSYGFIEASLGVGSIIGGLSAGFLSKKISFKQAYKLLLGASIFLLPIAIALTTFNHPNISYTIILISIIFVMGFATLFTIYGQTLMQTVTPTPLLGKLASVVTVISMCALPIGQALYGLLFDWAQTKSFLVVIVSALLCIVIGILSKKVLKQIPEQAS